MLQDFPGLHLDGCLENSSEIEKVSSVLSCGRKFLSQNSNISYIFSGANQSCYSCEASTATGIIFNISSYLFLPRTKVLQNFSSLARVNVKGLQVGSVVYLLVDYSAGDSFTLYFLVNSTTYNLKFQSNVDPTGRLTADLSTKINSVWNPQHSFLTMNTYVINRTVSHYILVRDDKFLIYTAGKFCCEYKHLVSTSLTTGMTLWASMHVVTFSF
ncbi:uncharacterized protein LOC131957873 [Physella acuta]|uniref:uncharacterized protein LOC131957873 n=1 Tax=Physella acuta TaxID=109671 RepID=UPI0027DDF3A2|nr:uncharacterized protein LOC131957873 [Physella acuta]